MIEQLTLDEVARLDAGVCPDCSGSEFLEGPCGGMNVNIMCVGCGAKFNVIPGLAGSFGKQRLGRPEEVPAMSQKCFKIEGIFLVSGVAYVHAESKDQAKEMAANTREIELDLGSAELETIGTVEEEPGE